MKYMFFVKVDYGVLLVDPRQLIAALVAGSLCSHVGHDVREYSTLEITQV